MQLQFKQINGEKIDNIVSYSLQKKLEGYSVFVGCESIVIGGKIYYIVVVAFRKGSNGVHFVYSKVNVPTMKSHDGKPDIFTRLWKEAQYTLEISELLVESGMIHREEITVEFDYNNLKPTISNKLVASTSGWAYGLGYVNVLLKSDVQFAVKAANQICQHC
jgi:predicted RNase H-related nuclease YkuK (DUF458 family)